jgi:hypothetical protein
MGNMQILEIELWPCQYRVRCTTAGCGNLARVIVRRVAEGGAPEGQSELCTRDARAEVEAALAGGISVHDMRGKAEAQSKCPSLTQDST